MQLECNVVQKTSKAGNPYMVLRVTLCQKPLVQKDVFIDEAELAILSLNQE